MRKAALLQAAVHAIRGLVVATWWLLAVEPAHALVRVPADAATLRLAIQMAAPGEVIEVAPGNYGGQGACNLLLNKPVHIVGTAGPFSTIVNCGGADSFITVFATIAVRIEALTVSNCTNSAVVILDADVLLRNLVILDNTAEDGAGLFLDSPAPPFTALVEHVVFSNNAATRGGGIFSPRGNLFVSNSTFVGNTASGNDGSAVWLQGSAQANIGSSIIYGNTPATNAVYLLNSNSSAPINFSDLQGGLMFTLGGDPTAAQTSVTNSANNVDVDPGLTLLFDLPGASPLLTGGDPGTPPTFQNTAVGAKPFLVRVCGDGRLSAGEQCEDSGPADGCLDTCQLETPPVCGDGLPGYGEECEDSNTNNNDGCDFQCQREGTDPVCPNGAVEPGEQCDDNNNAPMDGCDACAVEPGFMCVGSPSVCMPLPPCGNSAYDPGEECDDGGLAAGDGCSPMCRLEPGFICSGLPSVCQLANRPPPGDFCVAASLVPMRCPNACAGVRLEFGGNWTCDPAFVSTAGCNEGMECICGCRACGNGLLDPGELCDDDNGLMGDGCSNSCMLEPGWTCSGEPSVCMFQGGMCGDGVVTQDEMCDDGDMMPGDGCSGCSVEPGYICFGSPSMCILVCGDSVLDPGEGCDDGDRMPGDGCGPNCQPEPFWSCVGEPSVCTFMPPCGDGVLQPPQQCDDLNEAPGDGCSPTCMVEPGFVCLGQPSVCTLMGPCGNGVVQAPEQCDDVNTAPNDGCSPVCFVEPGWLCSGSPSMCVEDCGDMVRVGSEQCDDGNNNNGDGCSAVCLFEGPPDAGVPDAAVPDAGRPDAALPDAAAPPDASVPPADAGQPDAAGPADAGAADAAAPPGDRDNDSVADATDNCPDVANSNQANRDGDANGDACDDDDDADGLLDSADNCPLDSNKDQQDRDRDGVGTPCDPDGDPRDEGLGGGGLTTACRCVDANGSVPGVAVMLVAWVLGRRRRRGGAA